MEWKKFVYKYLNNAWWLVYDDNKLKLPKYACKQLRVTTKTLEIQSLSLKPIHKIRKLNYQTGRIQEGERWK